MPPLPMPGDGETAGRIGWAMGIAGLGATGAGAAGLGATAAIGFAATAGLRAGALRAAGFRTAFLVVLRAEVFFAVVLRAVARFAVVLRAPVLRAVLRAARAVLRTVRAAFLAVLRGFAFLLVVRFFPLVLVAMACAPLLLWLPHSTAQTDVCLHESRFTGPGLPSHRASQLFFSLYDDRERKWQFGVLAARDLNSRSSRSSRCAAPSPH
jgi:hypothetical protein